MAISPVAPLVHISGIVNGRHAPDVFAPNRQNYFSPVLFLLSRNSTHVFGNSYVCPSDNLPANSTTPRSSSSSPPMARRRPSVVFIPTYATAGLRFVMITMVSTFAENGAVVSRFLIETFLYLRFPQPV